MNNTLIFLAIVLIICIIFNKITKKVGLPMILSFIVLGMIFGNNGLYRVDFNNLELAENISTIALIFIMFYGGFGTSWKEARSVSVKASLLASIGVILTAVILALLSHYILKIDYFQSFLIAAILSSTDAASVFSILKERKLSLKYKTDSLLEIESGSNDPFAYMLTLIILNMSSTNFHLFDTFLLIFKQVSISVILAYIISRISIELIKKIIDENSFTSVFVVAVALLSYSLTTYLGGNGYLATYIVGIIIGNSSIKSKKTLFNFFDGITGLMQIFIFFMLGLLSFPSQITNVMYLSIGIMLILTFIARPISVYLILRPFRSNLKQIAFVSYAGLRGAASIVFAIVAVKYKSDLSIDIFHVVFFIVLLSILLQGSLLPYVARKLDILDTDKDIAKTFSDYEEEEAVQFLTLEITEKHNYKDKLVKDIYLPKGTLIAMIRREDKRILPKGDTKILLGDKIILGAISTEKIDDTKLYEIIIDKYHTFLNKEVKDLKLIDSLIILIKRNDTVIVPNGSTKILLNDILIINKL